MATASTWQGSATKARPKTWAGGTGNTVIEAKPMTLTGISVNGGAGGGTVRVFDNATTNAGNVLFAVTLAAGQIDTFLFPVPLKARNGITVNSSAVIGAGSFHVY